MTVGDAPDAAGRHSSSTTALVLCAGVLLAGVVAVGAWRGMDDLAPVSDSYVYRTRMRHLFAGGVPYVDFEYEHYPAVLVPMALAWLVGGFQGPQAYGAAFAGLMALSFVATYGVMARTGRLLGVGDAAKTWATLSLPLGPFIVFRSEPFVVLLVAAGLAAVLGGNEGRRRHLPVLAAVAAKGWPVVLGLVDWGRGRRGDALRLVLFTVAMTSVLAVTPGFSEGRSFDGVQIETIPGSVVLAARAFGGRAPGWDLFAGAQYMDVPGWAVAANGLAGFVLLGGAVIAVWRRPVPLTSYPALLLLAVCGMLLASPLLSPQFLLWLTPFGALVRWRPIQFGVVVTAALTTAVMLDYEALLDGDRWPVTVLLARNSALLVLVAMTVAHVVTLLRGSER